MMKKILWEQLEITSAVPVKPYPSKVMSVQGSAVVFEPCDAAIGEISWNKAEFIPTGSVKAPILLLSLLWVISMVSTGLLWQPQDPCYPRINYFHTGKVPIYLKLGRLTYYC